MADARATLTRYDLWENIPATAATYLKNDDPDRETPKTEDLNNLSCHNFILVPGDAACVAAAKKAEALGFRTMILSTMLEGESRELGRTFAAVGNEIVQNGRPLPAPCVVIGGGETTVRLDTHFGMGGPNQEFALGAAFDICGRNHVLVAGIDSDGTDGPTDLAGALVDGQTLQRAEVAGLDLRSSLKNHNVSQALEKLGDSVITGATGTNVNDLKLLLVMNPKGKS
jgi:glycerate 2-kinase